MLHPGNAKLNGYAPPSHIGETRRNRPFAGGAIELEGSTPPKSHCWSTTKQLSWPGADICTRLLHTLTLRPTRLATFCTRTPVVNYEDDLHANTHLLLRRQHGQRHGRRCVPRM